MTQEKGEGKDIMMIQKKSTVHIAVLSAISSMFMFGLPVGGALAQQGGQTVTITGSSIKRVAQEQALPVVVIDKAEIERSGATTVRELIQELPNVYADYTTSDSVNGGGGGLTTANLKTIGSSYTLILLNGRRVAPSTTGSVVNLEHLPLSVVSRVEILADGASALYGSDAIAGVINFITTSNQTDGAVDLRVTSPAKAGADETYFSLSKGWGTMGSDGYNVVFGVSAAKQKKLLASQRSFSKSGTFDFEENGVKYRMQQSSINGDPPNMYIDNEGAGGSDYAIYNPRLIDTGSCGSNPLSYQGVGSQSAQCRFDYGGAVDALPESEQKSLYFSGRKKLNDRWNLFGEWVESRVSVLATFAPPAQPLVINSSSPLWSKYVTPYAIAQGVPDVSFANYYMRLADAGGRANDYQTEARHVSFGLDGELAGFDVETSYTMSRNIILDTTAGGYVSRTLMNQLIADGAWDPFLQGSAESKAAIAPAILGVTGRTESVLNTLAVRASGDGPKLGSVQTMVGAGFDLSAQKYKDNPASIFQGPNALQPDYSDFPVGSGQGLLPFDSSRNKKGIYGEILLPVSKSLELTAAMRHDSYTAIKNKANFDTDGSVLPAATQGNSDSAGTWKLATRFQPANNFLIRASLGTGFAAPAMLDITKPLAEFGVIGTQRDCPVSAGDPLYSGCRSVPTQYKLQTGGNPFKGEAGLKPEKSKQMTLGFVIEPAKSVTTSVDFWKVSIDDAIVTVPEDAAFDNFDRYRGLFSVTTESATGRDILTLNQTPVNAANYGASGFDLDITHRTKIGDVGLSTKFLLSHLFDSYYDFGFGGGKETSLGKIGADDEVAFRNKVRLAFEASKGPWAAGLTFSWIPGYTDQTYTAGDYTVFLVNEDGTTGAPSAIERKVSSYMLVDLQTKYVLDKASTVLLTVKNLMDKDPPLSIKTVGGNMNGFDPRYHDGVGRSLTLQLSTKF
jgi:iron complex outermembrane receptor protein